MGIRNKITPGYAYYLTLTVVEWIDVFSRPVYKHLIVDSLNRFGAVLTEKSANELITTHEYDNFGKKKKSTLPDGRIVQYEYSWSPGTPANGMYAVKTSATAEPYTKTYFDAFGRELRTETPSFSGLIYTDKDYNPNGSLYSESLPYFSGGTAKLTTYDYDVYDSGSPREWQQTLKSMIAKKIKHK